MNTTFTVFGSEVAGEKTFVVQQPNMNTNPEKAIVHIQEYMVCLKLRKEIGKFGNANICCDISDSGDEEKEEEEKKEQAREAKWSKLGIEVVWSKLGITFA
ncbi:hypothetical protein DVH24_023972 [Malus domestica]|uniref:Uncharacterized protein n=1 Tax=Malus domestica TaxID=3750 RepID=A0A498JF31_MALDO|nr:hypothetical protein DVH24_023972 [Malus domestica]